MFTLVVEMGSGKYGVGIVVNENTGMRITSFENVNNMIMKINTKTKHQRLTIIQICTPQQGKPKAEKTHFMRYCVGVIDTNTNIAGRTKRS